MVDRDDPPVQPREQVLHRHGGRVDVGERLVHLVDQQDADGDRPGGQGDQRGDHVGGAEVGDGEDTEGVVGDRGQAVAEQGAPEGIPASPGVPAVVGGQRRVGDHAGDGEVDPGQKPSTESCGIACRGCSQHRTKRNTEAASTSQTITLRSSRTLPSGRTAISVAAGPGQDHEGPAPRRTEDGHGRGRDDDDLHRRPADVLGDVEHGGQYRTAAAEHAAHRDHGRSAGRGTEDGGGAEQGGAESAADENRGDGQRHRAGGGGDEGAGERAEEADPEVAPHRQLVEEAERPGRLGGEDERRFGCAGAGCGCWRGVTR